MNSIKENITVKWLLQGDVSIRYQVYRDLLNSERPDLRERISKEGWGARFLSLRKYNGHWGRGFYQPKWTSTHYTLLDLKNLYISPAIKAVSETILLIIINNKCQDGGINPSAAIKNSDVCINGMFLNYSSYFRTKEEHLKSIVDFLLKEQMADGGFNCHSNRKGAQHSSLHTTLSVLEGIHEYHKNGYKYRLEELNKAQSESREFILRHRLFKSHRTGEIIKSQMIRLSYPSRWYYDILRAMDYFRYAGIGYDDRMRDALDLIIKKKNKNNRWKLQANHKGLTHFEMETVGRESRWNTLRSLRVIKYYKDYYQYNDIKKANR